MATIPKILTTSIKLESDLVSTYKIPFALEGTVLYWLWDDAMFILWDNGDRMRL